MDQLNKIKLQLGIKDEEKEKDPLLESLLDDATEFILTYCNREKLPPRLKQLQAQLAVISYNRLGTEGEQGRSEGGISVTTYVLGDDLPKSMRAQLNQYRLAKAVRYAT